MDDDEVRRVRIVDICPEHGIRVEDEDGNAGIIQPLQEGRPIHPDSELVNISQDAEEPNRLYLRNATHAGPAKVSSSQYRQGWDDVFGKKRKPSELN